MNVIFFIYYFLQLILLCIQNDFNICFCFALFKSHLNEEFTVNFVILQFELIMIEME
jgi:hypothetical protein